MNKSSSLLILIFVVFTLFSCKKDEEGIKTTSGTEKVYSVGYLNKQGYFDLPRTAKLWVDATENSLTDGTKDAMAIAVFLSGSDVYVAGYESNGTSKVAKLWKNGVAANLSDGTKNAVATSIVVSGADVYVAGYETYKNTGGIEYTGPVLWRNGVATYLPITDNSKIANASSVCIVGSDVYVAGTEALADNTKPIAKLWKNGVASVISSSNILTECRVMVVSSGSDIYTGCFERVGSDLSNTSFTIRKNGVITSAITAISLSTDDVRSQMAFAVNGSDVYAAGQISSGLSVLKNGTEVASLKDANMLSYSCIAFSGTDVFIGGMSADNTYIGHAAYIKNGATTILNNNPVRNSNLLGIAVKN